MKLNARIKAIGEPRSGVSANTGKSWTFQPITVEWKEQGQNKQGGIYEIIHSLQVDLTGGIAQNFQLAVGTPVTLDIRFEAEEYKGRTYNHIRSSYCSLCGNIL